MKCPGCAKNMVLIEIHGIEIDRCPSCGGIALDKGETEAIDALGIGEIVEGGGGGARRVKHEHRTTPARCHECARDMIELRGAGDVEYDWCDGCERLFFDRGELSAFDDFVTDA
jgi:Zn-finger nucleic acid-binding protein